jgi:hypothetical protein
MAVPVLLDAEPVAAAPPWVVESPAAAGHGARFGLGLDTLFEHQESLRIESQRTESSQEIQGGGTFVVDGDPDLLNRKFDLDWDLRAAGVEVPLGLSCFRLTDLIRVFPTLTLEAAMADVTLGSVTKTESNPKTTLEGRGPLFGVKLGATASLCGSCSWFTGISYHYRSLPALDADRSPELSERELEVLRDQVRLSQDVHEVSTQVGYVAPNQKVAYYTGVRGRWTDVDIEDELRLRSLIDQQTTRIATRTRLKSETIEAVAGVAAHLGGSIYGRTETTFSGQDYGVTVSIVHVGPREAPQEESEETETKARETAALLVPRLEQILAAFQERRQRLQTAAAGAQEYPRQAVAALLNDTERDLLQSLTGPELTAMRDYVQNLFKQARLRLALPPGSPPVRLASLHPFLMQGARPAPEGLDKGAADSWFDRIANAIGKILDQSRNNNLVMTLCVKTSPKDRAEFRMHPVSYDLLDKKVITTGRIVKVWRGLYSYTVARHGFKSIQNTLDLVEEPGSVLDCNLIANSSQSYPLFCQLRAGSIDKECPQ